MFRVSNEIISYFKGRDLNAESQSYIGTHAKRFAFLLDTIAAVRVELNQQSPITTLDIGPSFFTELLRVIFPQDNVNTLGFDLPESRGGHFPESTGYEENNHYHFNLNDAQHYARWIKIPPADLVVMAEVLEHLYTAPSLVLKFVRSLMNPAGILIVQTPNAASLKKRLRLLTGRHPYEMIREDSMNPGHYREYTKNR